MDSSREVYVEAIGKYVKRAKKDVLIDIARHLHGSDTFERFEQIDHRIKIVSLTCDQLRRYINGKLGSLQVTQLELLDKRYFNGKVEEMNMEECCICYEILGRQKNSLQCGHWAHYKCIVASEKNKCPICRADLGKEMGARIKKAERFKFDSNDFVFQFGSRLGI